MYKKVAVSVINLALSVRRYIKCIVSVFLFVQVGFVVVYVQNVDGLDW